MRLYSVLQATALVALMTAADALSANSNADRFAISTMKADKAQSNELNAVQTKRMLRTNKYDKWNEGVSEEERQFSASILERMMTDPAFGKKKIFEWWLNDHSLAYVFKRLDLNTKEQYRKLYNQYATYLTPKDELYHRPAKDVVTRKRKRDELLHR